ncbi:hypothetical protein P3X46_010819 [Hevea brasiliensis]|uniref:Serine-rich protein-like protein n=1 Tax=Hevea brasiliensis TaxID=3981 RepID=A0ABQ9MF86_HEVBR|nr:uncharacterized protein LOC131180862 [Hevea brasiliensis]KAJ9178984.1 hypothetical protein P3X46_010819 [Hevea brasiliensis]
MPLIENPKKKKRLFHFLLVSDATMATSRNKSNGHTHCTCRMPPPLMSSSSSSFASSTASSFTSSSSSSTSATLFARANSPTRVNMYSHHHRQNNHQSSSSLRLSIDRSISPNRSISIKRHTSNANAMSNQKRTCACSPTTHPGSFRCAFHRSLTRNNGYDHHSSSTQSASYHSSSRLNFRRSAMTNSLVRIGGVEGELVKRALSALIRPSSHHLRRRAAFETRPSRLSIMSKAGD